MDHLGPAAAGSVLFAVLLASTGLGGAGSVTSDPVPTVTRIGPTSAVLPATCGGPLQFSINATPNRGVVPLTTRLTANVSGGCPPYRVQWGFGDDLEDSGLALNHTFRSVGTFTVFAEAKDSNGSSAENRTSVHVTGGTGAFTVNVSAAPSGGPAPLNVTAWANVTGGNVSQVDSVRWTFGDGGSGNGSPIQHTFLAAGTYTLKAVATSGTVSGTGRLVLTVTSGSGGGPPANLSLVAAPATAHPPVNLTIYAFSNGVGAPYALSVCFGDLSPCDAGPANWTGLVPAVFPKTYLRAGNYSVVGTLSDSRARVLAVTSLLVPITPGPPLNATASAVVAGVHSGSRLVTFWSNVSGGTPPYDIQWWFGDGAVGSSEPGDEVQHAYSAGGPYRAYLTVEDAAGNSQNLTVVVVPAVPSASSPTISTIVASPPVVGLGVALGAAAIGGGIVIGRRRARPARDRQLRKEGEELVRELEERP